VHGYAVVDGGRCPAAVVLNLEGTGMSGIVRSYTQRRDDVGIYYYDHMIREGTYSLGFRSEYITAFCGARFACDFSYSYPLSRDVRDVEDYEYAQRNGVSYPLSRKEYLQKLLRLRKFFKAVMLNIAEDAVAYYDGDLNRSYWKRKGEMRVQLWEIQGRPMYWASSRILKLKKVEEFNNPNSNNDAAMFIGPLDWDKVESYKRAVDGKPYVYGNY
jgi:hypothetical protein